MCHEKKLCVLNYCVCVGVYVWLCAATGTTVTVQTYVARSNDLVDYVINVSIRTPFVTGNKLKLYICLCNTIISII